jgi:hypothetical protein
MKEEKLNDAYIMDTLCNMARGEEEIDIADTFFIYELDRKKDEEKRKKILAKARPRPACVKWIIPINYEGYHWILAVVNTVVGNISVYDSLKNREDCVKVVLKIRDILSEMGMEREWKMVIGTCFKNEQQDDISCGVYMLAAAFLNIVHKSNIVVGIDMLCSPWEYLRGVEIIQGRRDFDSLSTRDRHPHYFLECILVSK